MKLECVDWYPYVEFEPSVLADINAIVAVSKEEVAWLCEVSYDEDSDVYTVYKLHVPEQVVSGVTCTLKPQSIMDCMMKATDVNSLRMWGHSHVNMSASPSGQDDKQFREQYRDANLEWAVRMITNKSGNVHLSIIDASRGVMATEVEFGLVGAYTLQKEWKDKLKTLVSEVPSLQTQYVQGTVKQFKEPSDYFKTNKNKAKAVGCEFCNAQPAFFMDSVFVCTDCAEWINKKP